MVQHDKSNQWRRKTRARAYAGKDPAIGDATLLGWNPACHELIGGRKDHCLAHPKQESDGDEEDERICKALPEPRQSKR